MNTQNKGKESENSYQKLKNLCACPTVISSIFVMIFKIYFNIMQLMNILARMVEIATLHQKYLNFRLKNHIPPENKSRIYQIKCKVCEKIIYIYIYEG